MKHLRAADVLGAWPIGEASASPLGHGLINATWRVDAAEGPFVLQAVNPLFPPSIHEDIEAITGVLERAGLVTPRLVPTSAGKLWHLHSNRAWRLMKYIDGKSPERLETGAQAYSAGRLLGRFHRALDGVDHRFTAPRLGVHDTNRHLATLRHTLEEQRAHPRHAVISALARDILDAAAGLPPLPPVPDRVVHGDPKINNVLFDSSGEAICLVDLDTLCRMPLPLELGDAFRSWCNPAGEDDRHGGFSLALFRAALGGYAAGTGDWTTPAERAGIVPAILTVYVELAARFCADALNERYFGWNPERYESRSVHNEVRAESQLAAAADLRRQYSGAEAAVREAFGQDT